MTEESTVETGQTEGQSGVESATTTTHYPESEGAKGQSASASTTEKTSIGTQVEDAAQVFDPVEFENSIKDLPPQAQAQAKALRKSLQGAYTKKFQEIATHRQKIEAYDAFSKDPRGQLERMAQQLGLRVTGANDTPTKQDPSDWEPQSWQEVIAKTKQEAKAEVMQEMQPFLREMQHVKRTSIENLLSEIDPSWQAYEDKMMENLHRIPDLAKDPAMLYRVSVPQEVLESRAVQKALAKMEAKVEGGKVSGGSTTTKQPKMGLPDKPVSFAEAVKIAEKMVAEGNPFTG